MDIYIDETCTCGSNSASIIKSGPHNKLVCKNCGKYIKMISKKEIDNSTKIDNNKSMEEKLNEINFKLDVIIDNLESLNK